MCEENMLVTAHRPSLLHKARGGGGAPEPLDVHTLLLHHSEIAVPWECAHPEGAHLSLKKTTNHSKSQQCAKCGRKSSSVTGCQRRS